MPRGGMTKSGCTDAPQASEQRVQGVVDGVVDGVVMDGQEPHYTDTSDLSPGAPTPLVPIMHGGTCPPPIMHGGNSPPLLTSLSSSLSVVEDWWRLLHVMCLAAWFATSLLVMGGVACGVAVVAWVRCVVVGLRRQVGWVGGLVGSAAVVCFAQVVARMGVLFRVS